MRYTAFFNAEDRRGLTEPHTATSQSFVTTRMPLRATPHWRASKVPDEPPTIRETGLYYVPPAALAFPTVLELRLEPESQGAFARTPQA